MSEKFVVSSSPHISSDNYICNIMKNVLVALIPALLMGAYVFGIRAVVLTAVSIISCVVFESLWNTVNKKEETIGDCSACITGALLAFILPVSVPLWIPVVGAFFAIIIVKQLFGGLGQNFLNPALGARAFLLASWPVAMTVYTKPFEKLPWIKSIQDIDALSGATPLAVMKQSGEMSATYFDLFIGNVGGCIGEVSTVAVLIGFIYLLFKKIIKPHAPLAYILSTALFGWIIGYNGAFTGDPLFSVLSGGVLLGAVFMITDYTTSPTTALGNIIGGIVAGFLTVLIRVKGGYPEGVTYAIMVVNVITPLLDKYIQPKRYGGRKNEKR
ncbi:MAG: RnfABCDGE type electron transport complex subunit D [Clostridia bacterium]|nr:RnfABCDGE type electron transport complex subunit D [Clostridia bacterium]